MIAILLSLFLLTTAFFINVDPMTSNMQQYVVVAKSFMEGHLNIPQIFDASFYKGLYFWPLGPMPAVLMIPFIVLGLPKQEYLAFVLHIITFFSLYFLALKKGLNKIDSLWFTTAFFAASIYIAIGHYPSSWYLAQIVAASFSLLAVSLFITKKNLFLSGFFLSFAGLSRPTTYLLALFFILNIVRENESLKKKAKQIFYFMFPVLISLIFLGTYNYLRFDSPFESGYHYQEVNTGVAPQIQKGLFSLNHIPTNLYYFLIKSPEPVLENNIPGALIYPYLHVNPWGMSILFTSPILILLFFINIKNREVQNALITVLVTLIPILTYYGIGYYQFGFRYALDVYPLLFLLLLSVLAPKIAKRSKLLIALSSLFNIYLLSHFRF